MLIQRNPNQGTIEVLTGEEVISFVGRYWSHSRLTEANFASINNYLKYLRKSNPDAVEKIASYYREIRELYDRVEDPVSSLKKLRKLTTGLITVIDWTHLWNYLVLVEGRLNMTPGIKEGLDEKDREEITYFTKEYEDLLVGATLMKLMIPIWGEFDTVYKRVLGKHHVHIESLNLVRTADITKLEFWEKLEDYVENFNKLRTNSTGFSLLNQIGSEDIPNLLMSQALLKKIAIYDVYEQGEDVKSVVVNMYNYLNDRCLGISRDKPRDKPYRDEKGEEITVANRYKVTAKVSLGVITAIEEYCEDIGRLVFDTDKTVPTELIERYRGIVTEDLEIKDVHLAITGVVLNDVLGAQSITTVRFLHLLNCIVAAAALLHHHGFQNLAMLITSQAYERDPTRMSMAGNTNLSYARLTNESLELLDSIYPHSPFGTNPSEIFIANVIKYLISREWDFDTDELSDIRNETARMLAFYNQV